LRFWRSNGNGVVLGLPVTELLYEQGRVVQYLENARLEYYPENAGTQYEVMLGLLGQEFAGAQEEKRAPQVPDTDNQAYFPETGHSVRGKFWRFWQRFGGLDVFGYPLTEQQTEGGLTRQVFQRMILTHHPEALDPFYREQERTRGVTLLGVGEIRPLPLGRILAEQRGHSTAPAEPGLGAVIWNGGLGSRLITVNLWEQRLRCYEGNLLVYERPISSGRPGFPTLTGQFAVLGKFPELRLTSSWAAWIDRPYDLPRVPYNLLFHPATGGYLIHGTYWHDLFGKTRGYGVSSGCVNMDIVDAEWVYRWAPLRTPVLVGQGPAWPVPVPSEG